MGLRLRQVPAARGLHWMLAGWRVFGRKPLAFTGLFVTFLFAALVAAMLPWVGPLLLLACIPLLTLGFMLATRDALAGSFPTPVVFVRGLRGQATRRRSLIHLGLIYALATAIIVWLSGALDGGTFEELQRLMASRDADTTRVGELLGDPRLLWGLLTRVGLASLLSIPFWHAPALVHWGGQQAAQSLFSSTVAVWRCRGAFTVYALAWSALIVAFGLLAGIVMGLAGARQLMGLIALPVGLTFSTVFYTSLYFSFDDSFGVEDDSHP